MGSKEKIENAKVLIEETDKKITELEEKNKELIAYYQVMLSNNVYMDIGLIFYRKNDFCELTEHVSFAKSLQ